MIGLARHHNAEEEGIETPETANLAREGSPGSDPARAGIHPPARELETKPQQHPGSPLESYLLKLLDSTADAPHEQMPRTPREEHTDETRAPQPLDVAPRERRGTPETPRESKPLWQTADEEPPRVQAAPPVTRAAKHKPALRSYTRKERGDRRQKLMVALIPALVIVMVAVLKNSLGTRPTAKAANAPSSPIVGPAPAFVEIAWEPPAPYEPGGHDPMQLAAPPAAVAVTAEETTAGPTEPPVDLIVTGILYSEDRPMAIIDTQVVHEGQQIAGATVEKIDRDGIQFARNGRRWKQAIDK